VGKGPHNGKNILAIDTLFSFWLWVSIHLTIQTTSQSLECFNNDLKMIDSEIDCK